MSNNIEVIRKATESSASRGQNPYEQGSRYYDMWEANPYAPDKRSRKQTFWDQLSNFFGFRSGYDIYTDQANQAMAEEDARIAKVKGEDEYNSPEEAAARMRAAGENPDLLGLQGAEAASAQMPQAAPDLSGADAYERVGQFFNGVAQAITLASGMTSDIAKTIGLFQDVDTKKIANATSMKNLATDFLLENIGSDMPNVENGTDMTDIYTGLFGEDEKSGLLEGWANNMHLNTRQKKQLREHAMGMFGSDKHLLYDKWSKNLEARKSYGMLAGSKYSPQVDDFRTIVECMKPLTENWDKFQKESMAANAEDAQNKREYNEVFDATQAAKTENEANKREEQQAKLDKDMQKAFSQVMDNLTKKADEGSQMAFFLTLILPLIYQHLMNGSVNVARDKQGSMQVQSFTL